MRPIGREGGDGSAQRERTVISTIALLFMFACLLSLKLPAINFRHKMDPHFVQLHF